MFMFVFFGGIPNIQIQGCEKVGWFRFPRGRFSVKYPVLAASGLFWGSQGSIPQFSVSVSGLRQTSVFPALVLWSDHFSVAAWHTSWTAADFPLFSGAKIVKNEWFGSQGPRLSQRIEMWEASLEGIASNYIRLYAGTLNFEVNTAKRPKVEAELYGFLCIFVLP